MSGFIFCVWLGIYALIMIGVTYDYVYDYYVMQDGVEMTQEDSLSGLPL